MAEAIFSQTAGGSECSNNSSMQGLPKSHATFTMKSETISPAIGSSTRHFSPKNIAPVIPIAVPMDENASERGCQPLQRTTGLPFLLPF